MSFLPPQSKQNTQNTWGSGSSSVPPEGNPSTAKICIIGEAPGAFDVKAGQPFVGPAGRVLEQCLHGAGLIRGELYITNLIKHKISNIEKYYNSRKKALTPLGEKHQASILEELEQVNADIVIPLGNPATHAVLGKSGIMNLRGYLFTSDLLPGRKILPTIHPSAAIRGNYIYRHYITADLRKASECVGKGLSEIWPETSINIPDTFAEAEAYLTMLKECDVLSIDIEVINFEVSCIGFSPKPNEAYVIPFYHSPNPKWTVDEEIHLWTLVAEIMGDEDIVKIGQNFIFDMQFLALRNNILTRGKVWDTMIMHSLILPDFPKSLEFLVSLHTNRPHWKGMVSWKKSDMIKGDS